MKPADRIELGLAAAAAAVRPFRSAAASTSDERTSVASLCPLALCAKDEEESETRRNGIWASVFATAAAAAAAAAAAMRPASEQWNKDNTDCDCSSVQKASVSYWRC